MTQKERLIEILSRYFQIGDSYAYNLTRDKTAFSVGTMDLDDFEEFDEVTVADIADHLLTNGVIVPPCKVGDDVWVIDYECGEPIDVSCVRFLATAENFIIATAFVNDYDIEETIEYHIEETQENFDTDLKMYPRDDCFPTRDEAEKAIAERSKE